MASLLNALRQRHTPQRYRVRWLALLLVAVAVGALHLSWSVFPTRALWDVLDRAIFEAVNASLHDGTSWQRLWAHANRHAADLLAVAIFFVLYLSFVLGSRESSFVHRGCKAAFAAVVTTAAVLLSEQIHAGVERVSPSLVIDGAVRLSEIVTDLKFKDASHESYPGDHGIALICLASILWYYGGWRLGLLGALVGVAFVLPRVVVGAHWSTDVLVGSASFAAGLLGVIFLTPLQAWIVDGVCRIAEFGLSLLGWAPEGRRETPSRPEVEAVAPTEPRSPS